MRKLLAKIVILAAVGTVLTGCETIDKSIRYITFSRPMSADQIKAVYQSGTRVTMEWATGATGSISFDSNSSAVLTSSGKTQNASWRIDGNQLCLNFGDGRSGCLVSYSRGGNRLKLFTSSGVFYGNATRS